MSKPYIHALSSAKTFGGVPEDYMAIHEFLDSSKAAITTNVHRALTHNSWFISVVIPRVFGETFKRESDGKVISSRDVAEQHVAEDFKGFIPSAADYLNEINMQDWMMNGKGSPPSYANVVHKTHKRKQVEAEQTAQIEEAEGHQKLFTAHTGITSAHLDGNLGGAYMRDIRVD